MIKTQKEIEIMAEGGKILSGIMKELEKAVRAGITTEELNRAASALILKSKGKPSFLGYQGYPAALCTSVNEEVVHAIPSGRKLLEGDIISLDIGMKYKGFHTDMARTFAVGAVSGLAKKLISVTGKALKAGIGEVRVGNTLGDIGFAIQKYVESQGFNVVRELCGHGIGRAIHEDPQVLNYGKRGTGLTIKEGMVLCLEPMVTVGDWNLKRSKDGYGFETRNGSLSCHFEDTVLVTKDGAKVLTMIE